MVCYTGPKTLCYRMQGTAGHTLSCCAYNLEFGSMIVPFPNYLLGLFTNNGFLILFPVVVMSQLSAKEHQQHYQPAYKFRMVNSTRRLSLRRSSVSLLAMGLLGPHALVLMRVSATPLPVR